MIWVSVFFVANVVVLGACIWVTLSDAIATGFWGTTGFVAIGTASAGNLFKPFWMRHAIGIDARRDGDCLRVADGPEGVLGKQGATTWLELIRQRPVD